MPAASKNSNPAPTPIFSNKSGNSPGARGSSTNATISDYLLHNEHTEVDSIDGDLLSNDEEEHHEILSRGDSNRHLKSASSSSLDAAAHKHTAHSLRSLSNEHLDAHRGNSSEFYVSLDAYGNPSSTLWKSRLNSIFAPFCGLLSFFFSNSNTTRRRRRQKNTPNYCRIASQFLICSLMSCCICITCFAGLLLWIRYATRNNNKVSFLWFSDIHMEPYYNSSQSCFSLCRSVTTNWTSVPCGDYKNINDTEKEYGRYGCNTPRALLRQTLTAMKEKSGTQLPMTFGVFTGDLVAHGIAEVVAKINNGVSHAAKEQPLEHRAVRNRDPFNLMMPNMPNEPSGYYDESLGRQSALREGADSQRTTAQLPPSVYINATQVVQQTIETVVSDILHTFDSLPIFMAIGNCDVVYDYQWTTDPLWLAELHRQFKRLWNNWEFVDDTDFVRSKTGAYVVTQLPDLPDMRLISFNSLLFAPQLEHTTEISGLAQWTLSWLQTQLHEAAEQDQKVLLMYHIPVGLNAFSSEPQWIETYADTFLSLSEKYKDTIEAHLCGHFHYESFKLLSNEKNDPFGLLLMSPAISPFFFSNPSFREFVLESNRLVDYYNYFFDLEKQDSGVNFVVQHQFQEAYKLPDLSIEAMYDLYERLWVKRDFYTLAEYSFRRRSQFMPKIPEYHCSMINQKSEEMHRCVESFNTGLIPTKRMW